MRRTLVAAATLAAGLSFAPASLACSALIFTDRVTGETWTSTSPEGLRREQAEWRSRSDAVFLAQVSGQRLARDYGVVFTFTAIAPLYDTALPEPTPALARHRGNTCNRPLDLGDFVIVYADQTDATWAVVGFAPLGDLQNRPPDLPTERQLSRGMYPVPDYPE